MQKTYPKNIAVLAALYKGDRATVVEAALKGNYDLQQAFLAFSRYWKLKVTFSEPVTVKTKASRTRDKEGTILYRSGYKKVTTHVFSRLFKNSDFSPLSYLPARNGRQGYRFPPLSTVTEWEVALKERKNHFESFEQFKAKFDPRFTGQPLIQKLWNGTSAQHGEQYRPSDFRRLGKEGRRLVAQFLQNFKQVSQTYIAPKGGKPKTLRVFHNTNGSGNFGRDITISWTEGQNQVFYSSEYPGCGNGRYGLLVSEKEFLWTEDD